jgi:PAS domain S-box-containing protein
MDINDAELQMIGYTKDEIVGKKTWADLILPEQITEFEKHWHDITTKGKVQNLKYILVHKDGHQIDVLLNASARFDAKGNLISTRGSVLNITDRKRLEKEFLNIVERERRRIGQELHDSIGQRLTGIEFMTEVLEQKLSDKSLQEASYAAKITAIVKETTAQTRDLAKGLHPLALGETDLKVELEELVATTGSLFNISCTFRCNKFVAPNDISVAINLYRIVQEAITNAIRHGKAKNIHIELTSNGNRSMLTVKNDGLDFPEVLDRNKGIGLKIMEYRADMINGALKINRGLSGGTIVTCAFPKK